MSVLTPDERAVLDAFKAEPHITRMGWELVNLTGLRSGRLYPALARLERDGWLRSGWRPGRYPRRRYYELNTEADDG